MAQGKQRRILELLMRPVCIAKGHRPEGESIIQTRLPEINYIKRCGRCGRYVLHSHIGEMTLTKKIALEAKARYEQAMDYPEEETEARHV